MEDKKLEGGVAKWVTDGGSGRGAGVGAERGGKGFRILKKNIKDM